MRISGPTAYLLCGNKSLSRKISSEFVVDGVCIHSEEWTGDALLTGKFSGGPRGQTRRQARDIQEDLAAIQAIPQTTIP